MLAQPFAWLAFALMGSGVCVTAAWALGLRGGGASAVFGRSRMCSLHPLITSSSGKLLTDCNYTVNYVCMS